MAIPINTLTDLESYAQDVMHRANKHAPNVNEIVPLLVGAVLWRKDAVPVEIRERGGQPRNAAWVMINGTRYFFTYDRHRQAIHAREGGMTGRLLASFTNASQVTTVSQFFAAL